jgi:hypothetical protein
VAAVHGLEDPVRTGLHRQMQVGHQFGQVAVRRNQCVIHVARVAGGVADAVDAIDRRQAAHQLAQTPFPAISALAMPGIDVLAEQRDLAHPGLGQAFGSPRIRSTGRETSAPRV